MTAEEFLDNAKKLIRMSGRYIAEKIGDQEIIAAATLFSLGVERLLPIKIQ